MISTRSPSGVTSLKVTEYPSEFHTSPGPRSAEASGGEDEAVAETNGARVGDLGVGAEAGEDAHAGVVAGVLGQRLQDLPLGTEVTFRKGGSLLSSGSELGSGELAYSSWRTMRDIGTTDENACAYNDFALVKVDAADVSKVNPSIPFWGGPTGIDTDGTAAGDRVYSYGNSSLRAGLEPLSPRTGISLGDSAADEGWSHPLYTVTPGVPSFAAAAATLTELHRDLGRLAAGQLHRALVAPVPAAACCSGKTETESKRVLMPKGKSS